MDLKWRDERAAAYTRAALNEGDTLVILHPNSYKPIDPAGFELNKTLRVHSSKLLRTGSNRFQRLLSAKVQRRTRKIHGYAEGLPPGIEFVIDLNPTNLSETDAIELVSELWCSRGIRYWFTTEDRCQIPHSLVGGRDSTTAGAHEHAVALKLAEEAEKAALDAEVAEALGTVKQEETDDNLDVLSTRGNRSSSIGSPNWKFDVEDAKKWSARFGGNPTSPSANFPSHFHNQPIKSVDEVPDYCPWRHRNSIEALLQIIEGKEPKLDSAPQVWTLAVLAKYFDCPHIVVDRIATWIVQGRDGFFVEVLPEVSLQMGVNLKSDFITKDAFAILVSEEAFRIAFHAESIGAIPYTKKHHEAEFFRTRENLDESLVEPVQQAGQSLYTRARVTWEFLIDKEKPWFNNLGEFTKINRLREHASSIKERPLMTEKIEENISLFVDTLRAFVGSTIQQCLTQGLTVEQGTRATEHRRLQAYLHPYSERFEYTYSTLNPYERMMTRFLWEHVAALDWDSNSERTNTFNERFGFKTPLQRRPQGKPLELYAINSEYMTSLEDRQTLFNLAVLESELQAPSTDEIMPQIPLDSEIVGDSPFFNLTEFLREWATTTDTLLCLNEDEWRYLPQWDTEIEAEESNALDKMTDEPLPIRLSKMAEEVIVKEEPSIINMPIEDKMRGPEVNIPLRPKAPHPTIVKAEPKNNDEVMADQEGENSDEFDHLSDIEDLQEQNEWVLVDGMLQTGRQTQRGFNRERTMPEPAAIINGVKTFIMLENNPQVINALSATLGLSDKLEWVDIYSLTDTTLLSFIPRPVLALLAIIPLTPAWKANRVEEDACGSIYTSPTEGDGTNGGVLWFKQTIGHACGSIGLLHCLVNGPAKEYIGKGSTLEKLREAAIGKSLGERAKLLYESKEFEVAHMSVAGMGDTLPPDSVTAEKMAGHFVSFVIQEDTKSGGKERRVWELEGNRQGPICRGILKDEDGDLLSEKALEMGIGRIMELDKQSGGSDLRFSCIALVKKDTDS
ncbi:hypothetical protein G7Y89_g3241 [Cudoniella acicularis]|uniref:Ubiquitin carboxyl-terminal hydrolase n=1 Tax=Cudoniella acicularis TaxID=354080 RepID=A0A8H4RRS1_9HELO|nr:hypothetical protein G7Y89_g3241 [Cudoniella acicularis]